MKIAIMQPYFFPYIGYFQLIGAADRFFICDEVQYIRHGWINRNRIYSRSPEAFAYIIMPVKKHAHTAAINTIQCSEANKWKRTIMVQTEVYKKAPYYKQVRELLQYCFQYQHTGVSRLNVYFLQQVMQYIRLDKTIELHEGSGHQYAGRNERPIAICKSAGATTYINMIGGRELYSNDRFMAAGLQLNFLKPVIKPYPQLSASFVPGLSIIDVMMYHTPAEVKAMICEYEIVPA